MINSSNQNQLNIVIPMAGRGSRFADQGYFQPKPLIPIHGKPMIEVVIDNLRPRLPHHFHFVMLREHLENFELRKLIDKAAPDSTVIAIDEITDGPACTVLLVEKYINNDTQLMIANCDQWVDIAINDYLADFTRQKCDGFIMTMKASDPKWSFVEFNTTGKIIRIVEKEVVSNEATVGIYNFRRGSDFVRAARQMIAQNFRVNNEFYVAPTYNQLIHWGMPLGVYSIGSLWNGMYGLGTPSDLERFLSLPISRRAAGNNSMMSRAFL